MTTPSHAWISLILFLSAVRLKTLAPADISLNPHADALLHNIAFDYAELKAIEFVAIAYIEYMKNRMENTNA